MSPQTIRNRCVSLLGLPDLPEDLSDLLVDSGSYLIAGHLFDLGDYPGLRKRKGEVAGELSKVLDADAALGLLDGYERYDASQPAGSLFVRRLGSAH